MTGADGHELNAYVARPEGAPVAGLVVVQEIFGVNTHIRSIADGYQRPLLGREQIQRFGFIAEVDKVPQRTMGYCCRRVLTVRICVPITNQTALLDLCCDRSTNAPQPIESMSVDG